MYIAMFIHSCTNVYNVIDMFGVSTAKVDNNYDFEERTELTRDHERRRDYEGSLENGEITQFYFKKLKELEMSLALVIVINIYLIIVSTYQYFPSSTPDSLKTLQICLYFSLLCVGAAIILLTMRTLTVLRLQKQQKQIYEKATVFSSRKIFYLLIDWTILLVQPYPFLTDTTIRTQNSYEGFQMQYPLNDLLAILSFGRVYVLFKTALFLTPYMNNRANRLCKMYGCRADFSYSLKCLFKEHPLRLICICYTLSACVFGYLVYLAERQILIQGPQGNINATTNYLNALWLILITTTTVGYGDYFPQTPLGRIIILFVAIWGTLIVSIMLVVVTNTLSMESCEIRTAKILDKLELRGQLQEKAERFIGYFLLFKLSKRRRRVRRDYMRRLMKAKGQFSLIRKEMKEIVQFNDLQDEVATHFLKLNSDIETLNKNQDLILEFIHNNFNANPQQPVEDPPSSQQIIIPSEKQFQPEEEDEEQAFMKVFRSKIAQHKLQRKQKRQ